MANREQPIVISSFRKYGQSITKGEFLLQWYILRDPFASLEDSWQCTKGSIARSRLQSVRAVNIMKTHFETAVMLGVAKCKLTYYVVTVVLMTRLVMTFMRASVPLGEMKDL